MPPPPLNLRYEKKFVAEGFTLADVLSRVQRHTSVFREVFPPRLVNNVYLDSPTRRDYHDHVNGTANRSKTRVRWYGPHAETADLPMLERKFKLGLVSGKDAHALPPFPINGGCIRESLEAAVGAAALPPMWQLMLRHLEPALFNRYWRHYFASRDGRFRLTVDSDLQFASVPHGCRPAIFSLPAAPTVIMELKFGPEFAEAAGAVTNALPFRVARFSKYVAGTECI